MNFHPVGIIDKEKRRFLPDSGRPKVPLVSPSLYFALELWAGVALCLGPFGDTEQAVGG